MILDTRSALDRWTDVVDLEEEVWRAEEVAREQAGDDWIREVREHVMNVADTEVDDLHDDELRRVLREHVKSAEAAIAVLDSVIEGESLDEHLSKVFNALAEIVGDWQAREVA